MSTRNEKVSEQENISHRVSNILEQMDWSQDQLADVIGYSRNYVSMVKGGRKPGKGFVSALLTFERDHGIKAPTKLANSAQEKLVAAMERAKMTPADVAKRIHYQIGVVQAVAEGSGRIKEDMAKKIEALNIGVTAEELMDGSDSPQILDQTGRTGTVGSIPKVKSINAGRMRMIPLISMTQAGPSINFEDDIFQHDAVAVADVKDPKAFALTVRGNSMEPEIKEGDVAVICPSWQPRNGDEVICRTVDGDVMCKIYHTKFNGQFIILSSYNAAHPTVELRRDEIEWIYPVQSVQKTRRRE